MTNDSRACTFETFHDDDFVAQLVEQLTLNQWVEGSSPSGVTFSDAQPLFLFRKGGFFSLIEAAIDSISSLKSYSNLELII